MMWLQSESVTTATTICLGFAFIAISFEFELMICVFGAGGRNMEITDVA